MGWVLLFIVLLAAALGVLGAVLKIAAAVLLALFLVIVIFVAIVWLGFKYWVRDLQRQAESGAKTGSKGGSAYDVTGSIRTEGNAPDPGATGPIPLGGADPEDDPDQD